VAVLSAASLILLLWFHRVAFYHGVPLHNFRASQPVASFQQAQQLMGTIQPLLSALHHKFPGVCAFAAPNLLVYEQFLLLRTGTQNYTVVMNPVLVPTADSKVSTLSEASYMCDDATVTQTRERYDSVVCSYFDSEWQTQKQVFTGALSVCLQHFVDIFNGTWPCNHTDSEARVPRHLPLKDL